VWQCSGRVKVLPCSRVAHLERHYKPYSLDLSIPLKQNALRVAEIWMDEYKDMVYMAWNIPLQFRPGLEQKQRWMKEEENSRIDFGDVSSRMALQKKLKCKTFDWYLKNVYPVLKPIHSTAGYGRNVYYHLTGEVYVGTLIAETDIDDCCLTHPGKGEKPTLEPCSKAVKNRLHIHWDFKPPPQTGENEAQRSKRQPYLAVAVCKDQTKAPPADPNLSDPVMEDDRVSGRNGWKTILTSSLLES
ncbi:hypothetical protein E2I00_020232, partial [Balaenoptera physalus]